MNLKIDILEIDTIIKNAIIKNEKKTTISQVFLYDKLISKNVLTSKTKTKIQALIKEHKQNTRTNNVMDFYLLDTFKIINEYKNILNTPLEINTQNMVKNMRKKNKLIRKFINIVRIKYSQFYNKYMIYSPPAKTIRLTCENCKNTNNDEFITTDKNIFVCKVCFCEIVISNNNSSYKDGGRININSKHFYERAQHFHDAILQYQAKQNCSIKQEVYDNLINCFKRHSLLNGDEHTPQKIRFQNITKEHILIFLKELGYSKHYENVHLIHYNLTCIPPNDLGHLENKLMSDFKKISVEYDKLDKTKFHYLRNKRKSFINCKHLFYQLLRRHKYKCDTNDFKILKIPM